MAASTPETGQRVRFPNLEVLRGVAALAVLVGHAYGLSGRGVPLSATSARDGLLMVSPTGVWLFFCLSGLVIAQPFVRRLVEGGPTPGVRSYAARRAARIYPLFLVCAAATLLTIGTDGDGPRALGAHLLLLHNLLPTHQLDFIGVTWTLSLELLFYALIPLLAFLVRRLARRPVTPAALARMIVWTASLSIAWMLAGGALGDASPVLSLYVRLLLPAMWSAFCPGLLIAVLNVATDDEVASSAILRSVHRLRTDARQAWLFGGACAVLGVASSYAQVDWGTSTYLWLTDLGRVAWSLAFGVLVLRAIDRHDLTARTPRPLVSLGTWSYGVYLIHGTVIAILVAHDGGALVPLPHGGTVAFLVHVAFVLGFTIPLSWLSWRFIEQPAIAAARRVRSRPGSGGGEEAPPPGRALDGPAPTVP